MGTSVVVVDAFTDRAFAGNPAAVCILDGPADDRWMRDVAREMRHSETAFCHPDGDVWQLRWFTPTTEVDLCGHATLATTHVLTTDHDVEGPVRYLTRSGLLAAQAIDGGIVLDFPADPTRRADAPSGLLAALGVDDDTIVRRGRTDYLVVVDSPAQVRALSPHMGLLGRIDCRGVIVSARADDAAPHDVVSRFFAPRAGVDEDPVTGSAHCMLAPYWSARLGEDRLHYHQASERGGDLEVTRVGDRVEILGHAVTVLRGEIVV